MARNKLYRGAHVIGTKGSIRNKHGDVTETGDSIGTPTVTVKWKNGGSDTLPEDMLKISRECGGSFPCP